MASYQKGKKQDLVRRGAPILMNRPEQLSLLKEGKMDQERIDSGLGDSIKSERESQESNSEGVTSIEEEFTNKMTLNEQTEHVVCDDASTNIRHPEPCTPPQTTSASPKSSPQMSPMENVMSFAQSNDVRHLLAPYRHHLLQQNEDGDTPIHLAVIHSLPHIEAFVSIAPSKECLNIYNYLTQTPLHLAVITRQSSVVSILLQGGASIDLVDRKGKTALHLACERGDMDIVNILTQFIINTYGSDSLELHVMLNARDYQGFSALHLAVKHNCLDVISLLVSLGANVDLQDGTSGRTAVHLAVEDNNLRMLNFLLHNCNADVDAQRYDENSPLHIAAGTGMIAMTGRLLAAGGDLSLKNCDGETPLDHATPEVLNVLKDLL